MTFDDLSDDICGAVVSDRAEGDKIATWTTECESRAAVTHIGRYTRKRSGLSPTRAIGYQSQGDTAGIVLYFSTCVEGICTLYCKAVSCVFIMSSPCTAEVWNTSSIFSLL